MKKLPETTYRIVPGKKQLLSFCYICYASSALFSMEKYLL